MDADSITESEFIKAMGSDYKPRVADEGRLIPIDTFSEDLLFCMCDKDIIPEDLQDELNELIWRVLDIAFPNKY